MAVDSESTNPSSSTSTGVLPMGFIARNAACLCSAAIRSTVTNFDADPLNALLRQNDPDAQAFGVPSRSYSFIVTYLSSDR